MWWYLSKLPGPRQSLQDWTAGRHPPPCFLSDFSKYFIPRLCLPVMCGGVRWSGPGVSNANGIIWLSQLETSPDTEIGLTQRWGREGYFKGTLWFILRTEKVNLHVSLYVISLNICWITIFCFSPKFCHQNYHFCKSKLSPLKVWWLLKLVWF